MIPARIEYRIPGLPGSARLVLFALLSAAGIVLQLFLKGGLAWGTLFLVLPLFLLAAKPWTNKPRDLGFEDWKPVGTAEFDRLADAFRSTRAVKLPYWYRPLSGVPLMFPLVFLFVFFMVSGSRLSLAAFDALLLLWPALHFLRVRLWIDRNFELSMGALQAALSVDLPNGLTITPYLRLDRDANGLSIPEDARLMVESKRKNEDLVGIQLQCAINTGPNGAVPYLYAVVLTRGKGKSWRIAAAFEAARYEVEAGGDEEYGTVVIRQSTGGSGYCTTPQDCRRLMGHVLSLLQALSTPQEEPCP